jgi:hypothetical protein
MSSLKVSLIPDQENECFAQPTVGYCTNVHSGVTLDEVKRNLERHTLDVKRIVCPQAPMGVGLWLGSTATNELTETTARSSFRDWLQQRGLVPYTVNAFPAGDFHQSVVKHDVYHPTWAEPFRLGYTQRVARILADLLPAGSNGTISTLPLGWPSSDENNDDDFYRQCGRQLMMAAETLARLEESHDVHIRLCIEPEPGCVLDTCDDVVSFFERYLLSNRDHHGRESVDRYLGVCHDICHSAVMFEPQSRALDRYAQAGIVVGKVQVSSAIEVDFESLNGSMAKDAIKQLTSFAEPRYLHQTNVRIGDLASFHEDLPLALQSLGTDDPSGRWRIHFHVPIYESSFGLISSTQSQIVECIDWFESSAASGVHFEVETYAWNVMPESLQPERLSAGIAKEIQWFTDRIQR